MSNAFDVKPGVMPRVSGLSSTKKTSGVLTLSLSRRWALSACRVSQGGGFDVLGSAPPSSHAPSPSLPQLNGLNPLANSSLFT